MRGRHPAEMIRAIEDVTVPRKLRNKVQVRHATENIPLVDEYYMGWMDSACAVSEWYSAIFSRSPPFETSVDARYEASVPFHITRIFAKIHRWHDASSDTKPTHKDV